MWVRDYGPTFVRWSNGDVTVLEADYLSADRPNDAMVSKAVAILLNVPLAHVPLTIEGGNLLSNGQGLCLTSTALLDRNYARGYGQQEVSTILSQHYGFYTGLFLARLKNEITGHVDMFATFTAPDVLLVGEYDRAIDPDNARLLDRNAEALRGVQTRRGRLNVLRIPMPNNRDGVWRTYTNVVYANGRLLVPSYPDQDQELEKKAHAVFAEALPGWQIIPIDCETMIRQRGALRCVTLNIPWLADRFELPTGPILLGTDVRT
jgi:agmatine/peptidylarginine deiminase